MLQIKHLTAPQKMPNFQFSRRANWPWREKILSAPPARTENYCESKQTYFSYSLYKAFHSPEFQAKLGRFPFRKKTRKFRWEQKWNFRLVKSFSIWS